LLFPRTRARTRFAADDHPVDTFQRQDIERSDQRLEGQESDLGGHLLQMSNAIDNARILDTRSHPHVFRPRQVWRERLEAICSLGEYLERVLRAFTHRLEYPGDIFPRHFLVEEIAHRIDE